MAKPVMVKIYYRIAEKIFERGDYHINGKKIRGHRDYHYASAVWLTWNLPKSKKDLLKAIKKWNWEHGELLYDYSKVDLQKRRQSFCRDYKDNNEVLAEYEKFNGEEDTIVTRVENEHGPEEIRVYFDDGDQKNISVGSPAQTFKELKRLLA